MRSVGNKYGYQHLVRVTHDDLLVDVQNLHLMAGYHLKCRNDYTYVSLIPEGCGSEIIKFTAIENALYSDDHNFEGISNYFRNKTYKWDQYKPNYAYQYQCRITMDTYEDYILLRILAEQLPDPLNRSVSLDFIHHLKNYPSLKMINKSPLVTIYIPNYNYADYLKEAIDSALNQSFDDFELLVIDDCSTDNSFQVLKEYIYPGSPVRMIFNKENLGLPATCNKAIGHSRGKYICRIDADDKLDVNAIATLLKKFEQDPSIHAVFPGYLDIDKKGFSIRENKPPFDSSENSHHPTGCLVRKQCWEDLRYNDLLTGYESYDFIKRFAQVYKIGYVDAPLWFKREHGKNMSKESQSRNKLKEKIDAKFLSDAY